MTRQILQAETSRAGRGLIALGILLRVLRYSANRSLWLDEAMLAWNITTRDFAQLTEPLEYNQGAPVGFLMLVKATTLALGNHEFALRLIPLLAGCLSVFLFWLICQRILHWSPAVWALAMFVCAEPLIYYSGEVKQYSSDVACTLLIIWLALRVSQQRGWGIDALAVAGAVGLWFSHPLVFVLAGVGVALFLQFVAAKRWKDVILVTAIAGLWLISFAAHYFMALKNLSGNAYLLDYWKWDFLPLPSAAWGQLWWYPVTVLRVVRDPLENLLLPAIVTKALALLALAVIALGITYLYRRQRRILVLLLLPLLFLAIASAAQRYPLRGRLILFLHPLWFLLMAAGLEYVRQGFKHGVCLSRSVAVILLLPLVASALYGSFAPPPRDELRTVLQYIAARPQRSDCLYLLAGSGPGTRYYIRHDPTCQPRGNTVIPGPFEVWIPKNRDLNEYDEFLKVAPRQRVWIVFATTSDHFYKMQEERAVKKFDAASVRVDEIRVPGASAYLYDLTK